MRHVGVQKIVGIAAGNDEIAQSVGYVAHCVWIERIDIFPFVNLELIGVHVRLEFWRTECPHAVLLVHLALAEVSAKREPYLFDQACVFDDIADNIYIVGLIELLRLSLIFVIVVIIVGAVDSPQNLGRETQREGDGAVGIQLYRLRQVGGERMRQHGHRYTDAHKNPEVFHNRYCWL